VAGDCLNGDWHAPLSPLAFREGHGRRAL